MFTPLSPASPDLYYILVAFLAYRLDVVRSVAIILIVSCTLDVFSGTIIGFYPLLCYGGYFLIRFISIKMPVRESLYQLPLVALSYLIVSLLVYHTLDFLQPNTLGAWHWSRILLRAALIIPLAWPLFRIFELLYSTLRSKRYRIKLFSSSSGNQFRDKGRLQ